MSSAGDAPQPTLHPEDSRSEERALPWDEVLQRVASAAPPALLRGELGERAARRAHAELALRLRLPPARVRAALRHHRRRLAPRPPPDPGARLLAELTERARALRTLDAARVCRRARVPPARLRPLWLRAVRAARARLDALVAAGDAGAPPAPAEWRLMDALVLHSARRVVRPEHARRVEPLRALVACYHLVQLFRLEEGCGAEEWRAATAAYRARGRHASAVLLQRRWHELKALARRALAGAAREPARAPDVPPLLAAVARRFPHALTAPLPAWRSLLAAGLVHEHCDLPGDQPEPAAAAGEAGEAGAAGEAGEPDAEDELILVEQEIETVDLLEEGERGEARAALERRRTAMARRLQDELDRQLRELGEPPPAEHDAPRIDPKLLMTTSVRLVRVDDPRWRAEPPPRAPPPLCNLVKVEIKFEPEEEEEESAREAGETAGVGVKQEEWSHKKVRLPDIAEVRRAHGRMLTAQVAPLAAHTASSSSDEDALCIAEPGEGDEGEEEEAEEEEGAVLSQAQLSLVLARVAAAPRPADTTWRARYCCAARYHRARNAARARARARAGRAAPPALERLHQARCAPPCACCCRHLLAGEPDHAEQRARLLEDMRAALGAAGPPPAARPPPPPRQYKNTKQKKRKKCSSPSPAPPPPAASADPLAEWIRQRNINSQYFDLHLKKPPRPPPASPAAPPRPPLYTKKRIINVQHEETVPVPYKLAGGDAGAVPASTPATTAASTPAPVTLLLTPIRAATTKQSLSRAPRPRPIAPAPARPRPAEVVDLCEESPPPAPRPGCVQAVHQRLGGGSLSIRRVERDPHQDILRRLPADIVVRAPAVRPSAPARPAVPARPAARARPAAPTRLAVPVRPAAPARPVLLNTTACDDRPVKDVKVFKISADGLVYPADASEPPREPPRAPPRAPTVTNVHSKLMFIPKLSPLSREAPPVRLLPVTEAPGKAGDLRTPDGRRLVVMPRDSAQAPPSHIKKAPPGGSPSDPVVIKRSPSGMKRASSGGSPLGHIVKRVFLDGTSSDASKSPSPGGALGGPAESAPAAAGDIADDMVAGPHMSPEQLAAHCVFELEGEGPPAAAPPTDSIRLQGGAVVQPLRAVYNLSELSSDAESVLRVAAPALVVVSDREAAPYCVRGQYVVRTARALRVARAALWTPHAARRVRRLRLRAQPALHVREDHALLHVGGHLLRAHWLCRSAAEVAREVVAGARLQVVCTRTGAAHELVRVRAPRPSALALRCKFLQAAQDITRDVNLAGGKGALRAPPALRAVLRSPALSPQLVGAAPPAPERAEEEEESRRRPARRAATSARAKLAHLLTPTAPSSTTLQEGSDGEQGETEGERETRQTVDWSELTGHDADSDSDYSESDAGTTKGKGRRRNEKKRSEHVEEKEPDEAGEPAWSVKREEVDIIYEAFTADEDIEDEKAILQEYQALAEQGEPEQEEQRGEKTLGVVKEEGDAMEEEEPLEGKLIINEDFVVEEGQRRKLEQGEGVQLGQSEPTGVYTRDSLA